MDDNNNRLFLVSMILESVYFLMLVLGIAFGVSWLFLCISIVFFVAFALRKRKYDVDDKAFIFLIISILLLATGMFVARKLDAVSENVTKQLTETTQNTNYIGYEEYVSDTENKQTISSVSTASFPTGVVYDANDLTISITDSYLNVDGATVTFLFENHSSEDIHIEEHAYAINSIMISDFLDVNLDTIDCEIGAGKKAAAQLMIDYDSLFASEIEEIRSLEINFRVYKDYYKAYDTENIFVSVDNSEKFMFSDGNLNVSPAYQSSDINVYYRSRGTDGYSIFILNNTDTYYEFSIDNMNYNEYSDDDSVMFITSKQLFPHTMRLLVIKPTDDFTNLTGLSMSNIDSLEFSVGYALKDSYDDKKTDTIKINVD